MFSASMLAVIFLEMFIAMITALGGILLIRKYFQEARLQDLYVFMVLAATTVADLAMLFSQIAYNVGYPFAYVGFKVFLYCIVVISISVWFHLGNIYNFRSRVVSILILMLSVIAILLIGFSNVGLVFKEGVIVPIGLGKRFVAGFTVIISIIAIEVIFSIFGIKSVGEALETRYKISKTAGVFFGALFACLFVYIISKMIYFYIFTWFFAFFAMLFLFLFSIIPSDSPMVNKPLNYFKSRILFKMVIVLVIMIILSLQGMAIISIGISKKALSESVIEGYQRVAEDTIVLVNKSKIDKRSEKETLKSIAGILEVTRIGDRGSVFLISPAKNVFINRAHQWISLGVSNSPDINNLLLGKVGGGEIDIFGEKVIAAYIPIKKLGWGMIVGQPIEYAYTRIKQMETTSIVFLVVWIGLTIFIGIYLARTIEEPIKAVKKGIIQISSGDLRHKIKIRNIDEIGELAAAFNKMTAELKESQDSLLRADRLTSLGYMAAGMAHEIKNALVPLKTLTDLLQISGKDEMFIKKFNDMVPHEIERINILSTELLHYSRPTEPKLTIANINVVINEAANYLKIQARKKNVAYKLELKSAGELELDMQKMLQVITNLMLNSIEAMEEKGGNIWIRSRDEGKHVIVEVEDDGPGIPPDKINRIFVPFFTTKTEGTGMGLPIIQRIVADHGGEIIVDSVEGKGAKFMIVLPLIKG